MVFPITFCPFNSTMDEFHPGAMKPKPSHAICHKTCDGFEFQNFKESDGMGLVISIQTKPHTFVE